MISLENIRCDPLCVPSRVSVRESLSFPGLHQRYEPIRLLSSDLKIEESPLAPTAETTQVNQRKESIGTASGNRSSIPSYPVF